jgi:DNA-binding beta-propeller fold protein YncE
MFRRALSGGPLAGAGRGRGSCSLLLAAIATATLLALETPPSFLQTWGSFGSGPGQLNTPVGIAIDQAGDVFVTDRLNHRIQKFDRHGQVLAQWGSFGRGLGQFQEPFGIAVDAEGTMFVSEFSGQRIQKLDSTGIPLGAWGSLGTQNGQFSSPAGLALDSTGALLVADMGNGRIQKFDSDGLFLGKWGAFGTAPGQLNLPVDVAIGQADDVYVAEFGGNRVSRFTTNGLLLGTWGSFGTGDGQFNQTFGIEIDAAGAVYVADRFNHRVQKFDPVGLLLTKWGSQGDQAGQFQQPAGIAATASGGVLVVDRFNHRVQEFGQPDRAPVAVAGPDQSVECAGSEGAVVSLDGSASYDPDGEPIALYAWHEGATMLGSGPQIAVLFGLGRHDIELRVEDAAGNVSTDTLIVTVGDTRPPHVTAVLATPDTLWPPNGQLVPVSLQVAVTDACDPAPRCRIERITVNDSSVFAPGKGGQPPEPDWILQGDLLAALRAVKSSAPGGRVYTLGVVCTDATGGAGEGSGVVTVPRSQGGRRAAVALP